MTTGELFAGDLTVTQGDCMEVLPRLPDKSVDLVLCDPPYGTTACKWDSVIPLEPLWKELCRITKPGCAIIMTASQPFTSKLIMSRPKLFKVEWIWRKNVGSNFGCVKWMPMKEHESVLVFSRDGKRTQYHPIKQERSEAGKVIAVKGMKGSRTTKKSSIYENGGNPLIGGFEEGPREELRGPSSVQSFECAPEEHHESVLVFSRDGKATQYHPIKQERSEVGKKMAVKGLPSGTLKIGGIYDKSNPYNMTGGFSGGPRDQLRGPSSVQDINVQRGLHPTQKPVALMEYMIKTYSKPGELVLDFAMGSGTTGVACLQTGRCFLGIEMDPKYFEVAWKRLGLSLKDAINGFDEYLAGDDDA